MFKSIVSIAILVTMTSLTAIAQNKKALDSIDNVIIKQIINPEEQKSSGQEPRWTAIVQEVKVNYSDLQTDRAVTKAKIHYYYNKDWAKFSSAIVHYTEAYEDKEDLRLMNYNARFILDHSTDPTELKTALLWVKHAVEKEPANDKYQETYKALQLKVGN